MTLNKAYILTSIAASVVFITIMAPAFQRGVEILPQEGRFVVLLLWLGAFIWYPVLLWRRGRK